MSARDGQLRGRRYSRPARRVSTARLAFSLIICVTFAAGVAAETTKTGAAIANGTQRFLLFYSGVFALVALTAAVGAGLIATDRIIMSPGKRIVAQAAHRAVAFVSVAFLAIHILTEIMAARSHVIDSVLPFLSPGRTFYVGLGTIGSDLMVLLVATGIARRRFAEGLSPATWRVLHGTAYAAWPLSIIHSLVAGRHPKPYVSWSYGACLLAVGLALVLRSVATVRPRHEAAYARPDEAGAPVNSAAASAAAQAFLLHRQQVGFAAGVGAGLAPGTPAGLGAGAPGGPGPAAPADLALTAGTPVQQQWQAAPLPRGGPTPADGFPVPSGLRAQTAPMHPPTPADGMPLPSGLQAHTAEGGFAAHTPHGGMRAHTPPEWARHQTPAEGMPIPPERAPIPYQVQALHPAPPDEDVPGWGDER